MKFTPSSFPCLFLPLSPQDLPRFLCDRQQTRVLYIHRGSRAFRGVAWAEKRTRFSSSIEQKQQQKKKEARNQGEKSHRKMASELIQARWSRSQRTRRRPDGGVFYSISVFLVLLVLLLASGRTGGLAVAEAALPEAGAAGAAMTTTTSTTEKTTAAATTTTTIAEPSAGASAAATAPSSAAAEAPDALSAPDAAKVEAAEAAPEKDSEAKGNAAAAAPAVMPQPDPSAAAAASVPPLAATAAAATATTAPTAAAASAPAAPPAATSAEARAEDLLARANAVLALRRAGLLRGSGALSPEMASKTVEAVNANAPAFEAAGGVKFRPSLTQTVAEGGAGEHAGAAAKKPVSLRAKWAGADAWATAPASAAIENYASKWRPTLEGAQNSTLAARNRTAGGGLPFNLGNIRVQAAAAGARCPSAARSRGPASS